MSKLHTARAVILSLKCEAELKRVSTHCFVVMPDHVHWLATLRQGSLGHAIGRVKRYSRWRSGHGITWQDGYFDRALRHNDSLRDTARYIIYNPVRAGLAESVGYYPHWDAEWICGEWRLA